MSMSISSSAMLVELSISAWTGKKLDRAASNEVTSNKNALRGVAKVTKNIMGDCQELENIIKFSAEAREFHRRITMPWLDNGARLLPTTSYFKYVQGVQDLQHRFESLVLQLRSAYSWITGKAKLELGDMFDERDYPTVEELTKKFSFTVSYTPVPDTGDWRVDLQSEVLTDLAAQYERSYGDKLAAAMNDVWKRAHTALTRMSERLTESADGDKKVFRDSLVEIVLEVSQVLKDCNVTGDVKMREAHEALEQAMRGVSADGLRHSHGARTRTKAQVDAVLASLPTLEF